MFKIAGELSKHCVPCFRTHGGDTRPFHFRRPLGCDGLPPVWLGHAALRLWQEKPMIMAVIAQASTLEARIPLHSLFE